MRNHVDALVAAVRALRQQRQQHLDALIAVGNVDRTELVKHQLRDRLGKWIEMGGHVKWPDEKGRIFHGIAEGIEYENGNVIIGDVRDRNGNSIKGKFTVKASSVEPIVEKAHLGRDADGTPTVAPTHADTKMTTFPFKVPDTWNYIGSLLEPNGDISYVFDLPNGDRVVARTNHAEFGFSATNDKMYVFVSYPRGAGKSLSDIPSHTPLGIANNPEDVETGARPYKSTYSSLLGDDLTMDISYRLNRAKNDLKKMTEGEDAKITALGHIDELLNDIELDLPIDRADLEVKFDLIRDDLEEAVYSAGEDFEFASNLQDAADFMEHAKSRIRTDKAPEIKARLPLAQETGKLATQKGKSGVKKAVGNFDDLKDELIDTAKDVKAHLSEAGVPESDLPQKLAPGHYYHATSSGNVKSILKEGLHGSEGDPVHLSETDTSEFIYHLFGLEPGGFYEFENGHGDTITLLDVDTNGLELDGPRTLELEFSPDNDEHHMFFGAIPPNRIKVIKEYSHDEMSGAQQSGDQVPPPPDDSVPPATDSEPDPKKFEVLADPGDSGDGYWPGTHMWGKYGAAGVMLRHTDENSVERFLIVQRSQHLSSNKGKWQLPGGALESNENDYQGTARELKEELSPPDGYIDTLKPVGELMFNHESGWHYNNITADAPEQFVPVLDSSKNSDWNESSDSKWVTADEIRAMRDNDELHPALAQNLDGILGTFPESHSVDEAPDLTPETSETQEKAVGESDLVSYASPLVDAERASAYAYSLTGYSIYNEYFRDGYPPLDGDGQQNVANLDAMLERSSTSEDMTVFRGIDLKGWYDEFVPGMMLEDKAYYSSSVSLETAEKFATQNGKNSGTPVVFELYLPKGSKAIDMRAAIAPLLTPDQLNGTSATESEMLLPHHNSTTVTAVSKDAKGILHVKAVLTQNPEQYVDIEPATNEEPQQLTEDGTPIDGVVGYTRPPTHEELQELLDYTGGGHHPANKGLRGLIPITPETQKMIDALQGLLAKSFTKEDIVVYRGGNGKWHNYPPVEGEVIEEVGFQSTSTNFEKAADFHSADGQVIYEYVLPKGSQAIDVQGIQHMDEEVNEDEILRPPGVKLRQVSSTKYVTPVGGVIYHVIAELVEEDANDNGEPEAAHAEPAGAAGAPEGDGGAPAEPGAAPATDGAPEAAPGSPHLDGGPGNGHAGADAPDGAGDAGQGLPGPHDVEAGPDHDQVSAQELNTDFPGPDQLVSIEGWKKIGHAQGTNEGGTYEDPDGTQYYVKLSQDDDHARNEVLADRLYRAVGIKTANLELADVGHHTSQYAEGTLGTVAKMLDAEKDLSEMRHDLAYRRRLQEDFAIDVWLGNYDVGGTGFDNILTDNEGDPVRIDPGGALLYRAMGAPKGNESGEKSFLDTADQWDDMRTSTWGKPLFGDIPDDVAKESAKKVLAFSPDDIDKIVDSVGFGPEKSALLKSRLKARRIDIAKRAGLDLLEDATLTPEPESEPIPTAPESPSPAVDAVPVPDNVKPYVLMDGRTIGYTAHDNATYGVERLLTHTGKRPDTWRAFDQNGHQIDDVSHLLRENATKAIEERYLESIGRGLHESNDKPGLVAFPVGANLVIRPKVLLQPGDRVFKRKPYGELYVVHADGTTSREGAPHSGDGSFANEHPEEYTDITDQYDVPTEEIPPAKSSFVILNDGHVMLLQPGDEVYIDSDAPGYRVPGVMKTGIYIVHRDGTFSGSPGMDHAGQKHLASQFANHPEQFKNITDRYIKPSKGVDTTLKVGDKPKYYSQLDDMPAGSAIHVQISTHKTETYTKAENGTWKNDLGGLTYQSEDFQADIDGHGITVTGVPEHKTAPDVGADDPTDTSTPDEVTFLNGTKIILQPGDTVWESTINHKIIVIHDDNTMSNGSVKNHTPNMAQITYTKDYWDDITYAYDIPDHAIEDPSTAANPDGTPAAPQMPTHAKPYLNADGQIIGYIVKHYKMSHEDKYKPKVTYDTYDSKGVKIGGYYEGEEKAKKALDKHASMPAVPDAQPTEPSSATPEEPLQEWEKELLGLNDTPDTPAPGLPAMPTGTVGTDKNGNKYVTAPDGKHITKGTTVKSLNDGMEGTVVLVEGNGKYVKVKDADGNIKGRVVKTLTVTGGTQPVPHDVPDASQAPTPEPEPDRHQNTVTFEDGASLRLTAGDRVFQGPNGAYYVTHQDGSMSSGAPKDPTVPRGAQYKKNKSHVGHDDNWKKFFEDSSAYTDVTDKFHVPDALPEPEPQPESPSKYGTVTLPNGNEIPLGYKERVLQKTSGGGLVILTTNDGIKDDHGHVHYYSDGSSAQAPYLAGLADGTYEDITSHYTPVATEPEPTATDAPNVVTFINNFESPKLVAGDRVFESVNGSTKLIFHADGSTTTSTSVHKSPALMAKQVMDNAAGPKDVWIETTNNYSIPAAPESSHLPLPTVVDFNNNDEIKLQPGDQVFKSGPNAYVTHADGTFSSDSHDNFHVGNSEVIKENPTAFRDITDKYDVPEAPFIQDPDAVGTVEIDGQSFSVYSGDKVFELKQDNRKKTLIRADGSVVTLNGEVKHDDGLAHLISKGNAAHLWNEVTDQYDVTALPDSFKDPFVDENAAQPAVGTVEIAGKNFNIYPGDRVLKTNNDSHVILRADGKTVVLLDGIAVSNHENYQGYDYYIGYKYIDVTDKFKFPESALSSLSVKEGQKLTHTDQLDALPSGSKMTYDYNGEIAQYAKQDDGKWHDNDDNSFGKGDFHHAVDAGWMTLDYVGSPLVSLQPGHQFTSHDEFVNLPIGSVVKFTATDDINVFGATKSVYTKVAPNEWNGPNNVGLKDNNFWAAIDGEKLTLESLGGQPAPLVPGSPVTHVDQLAELPYGSSITDTLTGTLFTKGVNGGWSEGGSSLVPSSYFMPSIQGGHLQIETVNGPLDQGSTKPIAIGQTIRSPEQLDQLPALAVIMYEDRYSSQIFTKRADGDWDDQYGSVYSADIFYSGLADGSYTLVKLNGTPVADAESSTSKVGTVFIAGKNFDLFPGDKVYRVIDSGKMAVKRANGLTIVDTNGSVVNNPALGKTMEDQAGQGVIEDVTAQHLFFDSDITIKPYFVKLDDGTEVNLEADDQVFKSKTSDNIYITHADGTYTSTEGSHYGNPHNIQHVKNTPIIWENITDKYHVPGESKPSEVVWEDTGFKISLKPGDKVFKSNNHGVVIVVHADDSYASHNKDFPYGSNGENDKYGVGVKSNPKVWKDITDRYSVPEEDTSAPAPAVSEVIFHNGTKVQLQPGDRVFKDINGGSAISVVHTDDTFSNAWGIHQGGLADVNWIKAPGHNTEITDQYLVPDTHSQLTDKSIVTFIGGKQVKLGPADKVYTTDPPGTYFIVHDDDGTFTTFMGDHMYDPTIGEFMDEHPEMYTNVTDTFDTGAIAKPSKVRVSSTKIVKLEPGDQVYKSTDAPTLWVMHADGTYSGASSDHNAAMPDLVATIKASFPNVTDQYNVPAGTAPIDKPKAVQYAGKTAMLQSGDKVYKNLDTGDMITLHADGTYSDDHATHMVSDDIMAVVPTHPKDFADVTHNYDVPIFTPIKITLINYSDGEEDQEITLEPGDKVYQDLSDGELSIVHPDGTYTDAQDYHQPGDGADYIMLHPREYKDVTEQYTGQSTVTPSTSNKPSEVVYPDSGSSIAATVPLKLGDTVFEYDAGDVYIIHADHTYTSPHGTSDVKLTDVQIAEMHDQDYYTDVTGQYDVPGAAPAVDDVLPPLTPPVFPDGPSEVVYPGSHTVPLMPGDKVYENEEGSVYIIHADRTYTSPTGHSTIKLTDEQMSQAGADGSMVDVTGTYNVPPSPKLTQVVWGPGNYEQLKRGDKVYTANLSGKTYVTHADGTYSDQYGNAGPSVSSSHISTNSAAYTDITDQYAIPTELPPMPEAGQPIAKVSDLDALPVGSTITTMIGNIYRKNADGTWKHANGPSITKYESANFSGGVANHSLILTEVGDGLPLTAPGVLAPGQKITHLDQIAAMPAGASVTEGSTTWVKQEGGIWVSNEIGADENYVGKTHFTIPINENDVTTVKTGPSTFTPGQKLVTVGEMNELPTGSVIHLRVAIGALQPEGDYTKQPHGHWKGPKTSGWASTSFDDSLTVGDVEVKSVGANWEGSAAQQVASQTTFVPGQKLTQIEELNQLPNGSFITFMGDPYKKDDNGMWLADSDEVYPADVFGFNGILSASTKVTSVGDGHATKYYPGYVVNTLSELDKMPPGTAIGHKVGAKKFVKQANGTWKGNVSSFPSSSQFFADMMYQGSLVVASDDDENVPTPAMFVPTGQTHQSKDGYQIGKGSHVKHTGKGYTGVIVHVEGGKASGYVQVLVDQDGKKHGLKASQLTAVPHEVQSAHTTTPPTPGLKLTDVKQLDAMPVGSSIAWVGVNFYKQSTGDWASMDGMTIYKRSDVGMGIAQGNVKVKSLTSAPVTPTFPVGHTVQSVNELGQMSVGTEVTYLSTHYTKQYDGLWKSFTGVTYPASDFAGGISMNAITVTKTGSAPGLYVPKPYVPTPIETDPSSPWFGKEKPEPPTLQGFGLLPRVPDGWLQKMEAAYIANPKGTKESVQESSKWPKVLEVLDNGDKAALESLHNSGYIDDAWYQETLDHFAKVQATNDIATAGHAVAMKKWSEDVADWKAANGISTSAFPGEPAPSNDPFLGGPADWTKAHYGTPTADSVFDAVRGSVPMAARGASIATDSGDIEDLDVRVLHVIEANGEEKLEAKFKMTAAAGDKLAALLVTRPGAKKTAGIYYYRRVTDPTTGLPKYTTTPEYSETSHAYQPHTITYTDPATGARIEMTRMLTTQHGHSNVTATPNGTGISPPSAHNQIRIYMQPDTTSKEYEHLLKVIGVSSPAPASEVDIRALAENRLIAIAGGYTNPTKNYTNPMQRQTALNEIKQKYGIGIDDLLFIRDSNGRLKMVLSDVARDKIIAYTKLTAIKHHVYSGHDIGVWVSMLADGTQPGAYGTSVRWSEGIGSHGMSSDDDMQIGGGDYLFTNTVHGEVTNSAEASIYMHPMAAARRLDVHGSDHDNYGGHADGVRIYDMMRYDPKEVIYRHGIPRSDMWFVTPPDSIRQQIIDKLIAGGTTEINGIPVEVFVTKRKSTPPVVDESQWSSYRHPPAVTV